MTPEQRRAYLAFVRAHHPDRGGDHQSFVEGLDALRRRTGGDDRADDRVHVVHRKRGLRRLLELLRSLRRPPPPPRVR